MTIAAFNMPATGKIPSCNVFAGGKVGRTINGDAVVVPEHNQASQPKMPGQTNGFMIDALHQAAISGHNPSTVIDQIIAKARIQVPFRNGHTDGHS